MKLLKAEKEKLMGEIVSVTHRLKRTSTYSGPEYSYSVPTYITWKEEKLPKTKRGWIVGFRNRSNGLTYPPDPGERYGEWVPTKGDNIQAIMIAFSPNHNPIPCPLSGVHSPLIQHIKDLGGRE